MARAATSAIRLAAAVLAFAAAAALAQSVPVIPVRPAGGVAAQPATGGSPGQSALGAPVQAVTGASASAQASEEYRLGPGDVLRISVFNQPDLQTEVEVSEGGTVAMPLVGDVQVGGKTRTEAANIIGESLKRGGFLKEVDVVIRVLEYRSQQVAVLGEVAKPGRYAITRPSTVAEVIALAGGITTKGAYVVTVVQAGENGAVRSQEVNVNDQINAGAGKALLLRAGDTVTVPAAPVFYIYGEVRQPGSYPLVENMTVMQALSVGGGLTVRGTERGIRIERRAADGTVRTYSVRGPDRLQANDVLRIPESWF
jgi:polysaccharide export outer membrane protein